MGRNKGKVDPRVVKAAELMIACAPNLKVKEAMLAKGFSSSEAGDLTVQMRVRRYLQSIQPKAVDVPKVVASREGSMGPSSPLTEGDASALTVASSTTSSKASMKKVAGVKQIRLSSTQAQQQRVNRKKMVDLHKKAFKEATTTYYNDRQTKPRRKTSAQKVCDAVNEKYSTNIKPRMVQHYVQTGRVGESPSKKGPDGGVPEVIFEPLLGAFESYVEIQQLNCSDSKTNQRKELSALVNKVVGGDRTTDKLYNRLLRASAMDITASVDQAVKERRVRWTTYHNLKMWFDTWQHELLDLGFATVDVDGGNYNIPGEQRRRILNLDESCLAMDGSQGARGGRPTVTFYNALLPKAGRPSAKSSMTTTFIGGSGEALPPHFQFSSKATDRERERIQTESVAYFHSVRGRFGASEEKMWPCTVGVNAKGGMDNEEFSDYLMNSIVPLYPDAEDCKGKRVLIKIDSGPGRLNMDMIARLKALGFILYPGVPNTTSVSQETDQNYGIFKSYFRRNLGKLTQHRIEAKKSVSFSPSLVGLLVFGGEDPETGMSDFHNAFEKGFSREKCLEAWEKVGAVPLTMACLAASSVRHQLGVDEDPMAAAMKNMEERNIACVMMLNTRGLRGDLLQATLERKKPSRIPLTLPNSKERIQLLAKAKSHGQKFFVTRGSHYTSEDILKSAEVEAREMKVKELELDKKNRIAKEAAEQDALRVLESEKPIESLKGQELVKLLLWHGISKSKMGNVPEMRTKWKTIKESNTPPPHYSRWTDEDEKALSDLKSKEITMADTATGRLAETNKRELEATWKSLDTQERAKLYKRLKDLDGQAVQMAEDPLEGNTIVNNNS